MICGIPGDKPMGSMPGDVETYLKIMDFNTIDEVGDKLVITVPVPGMEKDMISVNYLFGRLEVIAHGNKSFILNDSDAKITIDISGLQEYDFSQTSAKLENGLLILEVPTLTHLKRTNIKVK